MAGDFNLPHVSWPEMKTVHGGTEQDKFQAELLFSFAEQWCLSQIVDSPTRGKNILDLVFTNNDEFVHNIEINETIISDHNLIKITSNIKKNVSLKTVAPTINPEITFKDLNFFSDRVDWAGIREELAEFNWESEMRTSSVDEKYNTILATTLKIAKKYTSLRKACYKATIPRDRKTIMRKKNK